MQIVLFQTIQFSMSTQFNSQTFPFQAIQFIQTILIQFNISIDFVYTVKCQNSSILNNSVKCKYSFNVKKVSFQTIQFCISTQ